MRASEPRAVRHVVKIGGSLLDRPNLTDDLTRYFRRLGDRPTAVIVGGGKIIDAVRHYERLHPSDDASAVHWRCVSLLDVTHELMSRLMPAWTAGGPVRLLRVSDLYRPGVGFDAPEDWRTTTDAIAVLIARHVGAGSVTLLKSCEVPPGLSAAEMARRGIIDAATPPIVGDLDLRIETL